MGEPQISSVFEGSLSLFLNTYNSVCGKFIPREIFWRIFFGPDTISIVFKPSLCRPGCSTRVEIVLVTRGFHRTLSKNLHVTLSMSKYTIG